jgi:hypothetical protein
MGSVKEPLPPSSIATTASSPPAQGMKQKSEQALLWIPGSEYSSGSRSRVLMAKNGKIFQQKYLTFWMEICTLFLPRPP